MFGETTISYVKIGNHPIETTIYKWLFGVSGGFPASHVSFSRAFFPTNSHPKNEATSLEPPVVGTTPRQAVFVVEVC